MAPAAAARVEAPRLPARAARRERPKRRVAGGVVWIAVVAVLAAGLVAMNVAVLRLNVQNDRLGQERVSLLAKKAQLASQLSTAAATPGIQSKARKDLGLIPANPRDVVYIQLHR